MSPRLHPLSVPYRILERSVRLGWVVLFAGFSTMAALGPAGTLAIAAVVGLWLLGTVLWEVGYHRRFEYDLTADTVDIRSGVLSRREREIPVRRIQNVDISRNVVQRALGIAAVALETAGGNETEASLRYVGLEEAKRIQRDLERLGRGDEAEAEPAPELLFAISERELLLLWLVSLDLRLVPVVSVVLPVVVPSLLESLPAWTSALVVAPLGALVFVLLSSVASGTVAVLNYYDFTLTRSGEDLRYERGLLRRFDGTIPLEKVQTLTLSENLLKRAVGYASLGIETAGYAPGQGGGRGTQSAVPLGERDDVVRLARSIEPFGALAFARPPKRARRRYVVRYLALVGLAVGVAYAVAALTGLALAWYVPLVALPLVPVAAQRRWENLGYALADGYVLVRSGFWTRTTKIVPYDRVQTVYTTQTPLQRRRDLATVTVDTASSASLLGRDARAVDLDAGQAAWLREAVNDRLQTALAARRVALGSRGRRGGASGDRESSGDGGPHPPPSPGG